MPTPLRPSTAGTVIRGLAAMTAILFILVAIPAALLAFGSNPLAGGGADLWGRLFRQDDGTLLISALTVAGWIAWATFAASILLEIPARMRGLPAPRLPGLSWPQGQASTMVAAVAAMIALSSGALAAAPVAQAAPASSHAGGAHVLADFQSTTAATGATQTTGAAAAEEALADEAAQEHPETVTVVEGDTLWAIAESELGDGARYPDLYEATTSIEQPDGRRIVDPDLIYPGWQIAIPESAGSGETLPGNAAGTVTAPGSSAPDEDGVNRSAAASEHNAGSADAAAGEQAAAGAGSMTDQDFLLADESIPLPRGQEGGPAAGADHRARSAPSSPLQVQSAPTSTPSSSDSGAQLPGAPVLFTAAGLGSLAAAGVLAALRHRRAQQSRRRTPGQRIALPAGAAAVAEAQMRVAGDPLSVEHLDRAVRTLAAHCTHHHLAMPGLRAARIGADHLELYLTDDLIQLPAPFTAAAGDAGTWILHRTHIEALLDPQTAAAIPAPYPALVTLGEDEHHSHLLLNLEEIGSLALTGPADLAQAVLTALTIELITSPWTDDSRITLVNALPDLIDAIGTDRATYVHTIDDILDSLEYTADVHRQALADSDMAGVAQARVADAVDETWTPHLILVASDLTDAQRDRIQQVLAAIPRLAVAAITTSTKPLGEWTLTLTDTTSGTPAGHLAPVPVRLTPQHLPEADYRAVIELFATTEADDTPGPEWTAGIAEASALVLADLPQPQTDVDETTEPAHQSTPTPLPLTQDQDAVSSEQATQAAPNVDDTETASGEESTEAPGEAVHITETPDDTTDEAPAASHDQPEAVDEAADPLDGDEAHPGDKTPTATRVERPVRIVTDPDLPLIRVLGPITIESARGKRPESWRRVAEIVAYLALFPRRSADAFTEAIFPGERNNGSKRNTYLGYARRWLGTNEQGRPFVGLVPETGYALNDDAQVDWVIFQELVGDDIASASTEDLVAALTLVTGEPISGIDSSRYEWAQVLKGEMVAAIADVAHEVAHRALHDGDPRTATWAAGLGLAVEPVNEALWRDAICSAWQTGTPGRARDLITRCHRALDDFGDLEDDTIDLINDIIRAERVYA